MPEMEGEGGGIAHVDGDGVAVQHRRLNGQLKVGRPGVAKIHDAVEILLTAVADLGIKNTPDGLADHFVRNLLHLLAVNLLLHLIHAVGIAVLRTQLSKLRRDELLPIPLEQLKSLEMGAGSNLQDLGQAVPDLALREGSKERRVEDGMERLVERANAVLEPVPVDGYAVRDRGVDEAD